MTRRRPGRRSRCPISFALDVFGDQWTLLVVRDIMLFGKETYQDFLDSGEGIASNVLADRLRRLESAGIVTRRKHPADGRQSRYLLTERGIDLLPLIVDLVEWSAAHDPKSAATPDRVARLRAGRRQLVARLRRRLED